MSQSWSRCPNRCFIVYRRARMAKEKQLTWTWQKFLCSLRPGACSQLWNKEWFAIGIRDLGSGTYIVCLYMGDLLFFSELWQCPPLLQEVRGISSVGVSCLRQFKFTLCVLGNWFIQSTSWHGDTPRLTCWRGQERKEDSWSHRQIKQEGAKLFCPTMRQFPGMDQLWDLLLPRSAWALCNRLITHQRNLPWDFRSLPLHSLYFVTGNTVLFYREQLPQGYDLLAGKNRCQVRFLPGHDCQAEEMPLPLCKEVAHLFPWHSVPLCAPWSRFWQAAFTQVSLF